MSENPAVEVVERGGLYELRGELRPSSLYNDDLAPTRIEQRTWGVWNIAALWIGMSVCIPTYMLASFMIRAGFHWWEAMLLILSGNLIVLAPMMVNAHAGTKYGIPFPVYLRSAFGLKGANVPAILRAGVACGWFGIQTWIGGKAIGDLVVLMLPSAASLNATFLGITLLYWLSFLGFWAVNMWIVWRGVDSIKWLESFSAPFLLLIGAALLAWALKKGIDHGGVGKLFDVVAVKGAKRPGPLDYFGWLTAMVGYWATLSLNIPDFTRFAKSQRDQMLGQLLGLPTTMVAFSMIGVLVTSATVLVFGRAIADPVELVKVLSTGPGGRLLGPIALFALAIATLSTNIAANVVSPANDISNLAPNRVSFRTAGMITGVIGIVILPWKLLDVYQGWLVTYSGLLGAVGGVIVAHYLVIERCQLALAELYSAESRYRYSGGFNITAIVSLFVGIAIPLVGRVVSALAFLFAGGWFFSFITAFVVYIGLTNARSRSPKRRTP
ncbi:MAG: NCS1 family nucleobase:cation symporter-1 [Myxococcales bacterium]|nr:NCS1 family nucleobase:cation symporter-1 [Myxococcales bacterium]